jgi:hypothetical protein
MVVHLVLAKVKVGDPLSYVESWCGITTNDKNWSSKRARFAYSPKDTNCAECESKVAMTLLGKLAKDDI